MCLNCNQLQTENMQNISDLIKESRLKSDHVKAWSNAKLINGSACSEQRYKVNVAFECICLFNGC